MHAACALRGAALRVDQQTRFRHFFHFSQALEVTPICTTLGGATSIMLGARSLLNQTLFFHLLFSKTLKRSARGWEKQMQTAGRTCTAAAGRGHHRAFLFHCRRHPRSGPLGRSNSGGPSFRAPRKPNSSGSSPNLCPARGRGRDQTRAAPGSESHLICDVEPTLPPPPAVPAVTTGTQLPSSKAAPARTAHWVTPPRSHSWWPPPRAPPRIPATDSHEAVRSWRAGQSYSPQCPAAAALLKATAPQSAPEGLCPPRCGRPPEAPREGKASSASCRRQEHKSPPGRGESTGAAAVCPRGKPRPLYAPGEGTRMVRLEAPSSAAQLLPDQGPSGGNASSGR